MPAAPRLLNPGRVLATGLLLLGGAGLPATWGVAQSAAVHAQREVQPGEFVSLPLSVAGAAGGTYAVEATLPDGWTLLSDSVQVGADTPALLNVYVPEHALAGVQQLDFRLTAGQDRVLDMRAHVLVPTRSAFTLDFPAQGRVRPGERRTFTAQLTNSGNAPDTFALTVEGSATVSPDRLALKPGESGTVSVAYVQRNQGTADSVTLSAASTVTPDVRHEAILALGVGYAAAGNGPQLTWQVSVSPTVTFQSGAAPTPTPAAATPAGGSGAPAPTADLPGLPGSAPTSGAAAAGPAGPWSWGGGASASIGGTLSDYATGSAAYGVTRAADGTLRDTASAQLRWGAAGVTVSARDGLSGVGAAVNYTRGEYTFGVNASRQAADTPDGEAVYTVGGGVTHASGVSVTAAQSFGGADTTAFGVGWRRQLGAYAPAVGVYAVHRDDRWGVVATQALGYENRALIARQEYAYDSLSGTHALNVKVNSRQVAPFGVSATAAVKSVQGVTTYALGSQVTYTPDDTLTASVAAGYGSDGFSSRVAASKLWQVGRTGLRLDGQGTYAQGVAGAGAQLTATVPAGSGEVVLRGVLGVEGGGVVYGAGAGYTRGALRVAAGAQVQGEGITVTGSAAYAPTLGAQVGVDLRLTRTVTAGTGTGPGTATTGEVRGSVGYAAERWSAAVIGGYTAAPGVAGALLYGAALGVNVTETVRVTATAQRSGTNTRVVLGAALTPGGALATPEAVVRAFGGRNAGTAEVTAFLDGNRNGTRDPGEGPVSIRVNVGPCEVTTDAQGRAQAQVRPGTYAVQLGDGVDAQYRVADMTPVTVPLKGTVGVLVAVQQTAVLQGQLRDDSGQPLAGVPVQVSGPDGAHPVVTDAEGRYRLSGLGFGAYTVAPQPDPAYYEVPAPSAVELGSAHALVTADLTARAIVDDRGVDASGLAVTVEVPQTPLPPGVTVPVVVRVTPDAERVTVDDPALTLTRAPGTDEWRGQLPIPAGQQGPLEVQVTAWRGESGTSERAVLLVDPALKASDLTLRPFNALPDQVVQLRATVYGPVRRVTVRDEQGRTILLTADGEHGYFADVRASTLPGAHTLTLMIDDQPATQAQYKVIGRP